MQADVLDGSFLAAGRYPGEGKMSGHDRRLAN